MNDAEKCMLHVGHCLGLLHAYYLLEASNPEACREIAASYGSYCRTWGIYNHITGEENNSGTPAEAR